MNTEKRSKRSTGGVGNTDNNPAKHWIITKPYKSDDITYEENCAKLSTSLKTSCYSFIFQIEKGEKTGYEHYQIYIQLKDKKRLTYLKKLLGKDCHIEVANNIDSAKKYCQKTETKIFGPIIYNGDEHIYDHITLPTILMEWQQDLLRITSEKPNDRTIHWYWDERGGTGKTTFAKYLVCKKQALYIKGKKNDILYAAAENDSHIYIIDLSRTMEDHVPYEAIEDLKNGIFFSGKYESKQVVRNSPHVIIFANFPPDKKMLSRDRWHIVNIDELLP